MPCISALGLGQESRSMQQGMKRSRSKDAMTVDVEKTFPVSPRREGPTRGRPVVEEDAAVAEVAPLRLREGHALDAACRLLAHAARHAVPRVH